jgi:hypothetical protein
MPRHPIDRSRPPLLNTFYCNVPPQILTCINCEQRGSLESRGGQEDLFATIVPDVLPF